MDLHLEGRTALVTGGSAGIGAGTAKSLAEEGCRVAITARRGERLEQVADGIAAAGHARPVVIAQDITAHDAATKLKKGVDEALGDLDILVNNGGRRHSRAGRHGRAGLDRGHGSELVGCPAGLRSVHPGHG